MTDELRLGQLIEVVFGCLNERAHPEMPPSERARMEGERPFCIHQLNDPKEIRRVLQAAYEKLYAPNGSFRPDGEKRPGALKRGVGQQVTR